ncbi:hypothetical protein OESDEN_22190 [Oesophagostomum dentatum]|uniref:GP-PDE domain-containing protein n=1 Tax=Oesophagostomum dentatum TaxID=61180 RepID=A0A0B1S4S1_OESDE|nr:hypothetical protein OESDEN_22190 [Oesophagostomum dentatum]
MLLTNHVDISKTFVEEQKSRGVHVAVWTVNDIAEMHWMLEELSIPILTDNSAYVSKMAQLSALRKKNYEDQALQNVGSFVNIEN